MIQEVMSADVEAVFTFNTAGNIVPVPGNAASNGILLDGNVVPFSEVFINDASAYNPGLLGAPSPAYTYVAPIDGDYEFTSQIRLQARRPDLLGVPFITAGTINIGFVNVVLNFELLPGPGTPGVDQFTPALPQNFRVPATYTFSDDASIMGPVAQYQIGIDSKQYSFIRELIAGDGIRIRIELPTNITNDMVFLLAGSTFTVNRLGEATGV